MEMNQATALQRIGDRRLFLTAAILLALIVVTGFARTYYLKGFFGTPPLASLLVHVHGVAKSAWVALFGAQVFLIRSRRVEWHKRVGVAGVVLAGVVVVVGFFTAISAAKNGAASFPPNVPRLAFLAVPLFDLLMMVVLFGGAIYYQSARPTINASCSLRRSTSCRPPSPDSRSQALWLSGRFFSSAFPRSWR